MLSKRFIEFSKKIIRNKIREKGLSYVFFIGLKRLFNLKILIFYPITFILCLVIRLIKPIFFIRFGTLNSEKIGPFVTHTELNLCEQENKIQPKRTETFNIYNTGYSPFICNNQLLAMWKRILRVYSISKYFWIVMNIFSFGKDHVIKPTNHGRDIHGLLAKTSAHLSFTKEEIFQAKKDLSKMGLKEKDKYVLMINRGQKYLDEVLPGAKKMDLTYNSYRNCSIDDFIPMANKLTKNGYTVIRMGHVPSDFMKTDNPKIIEYHHYGFRTDLLDIYLGANCRYIVGSDTGYMHVPGFLFRRPTVHVNFSQLEYMLPWLSCWLFIFKKYWLKDEKRFMRVKEILESGTGRFERTKQFEKNGIEIIKNTPEEIIEVVDEMEKRLDGTWQENDEDDNLQRSFWSHFKSSNLFGVTRGRIGAKFLKGNKDLFLR